MPRPCAVESHACCYKKASPLRRCHGLVPWRLTLAATKKPRRSEDATALRRGVSRLLLQKRALTFLPPLNIFSNLWTSQITIAANIATGLPQPFKPDSNEFAADHLLR